MKFSEYKYSRPDIDTLISLIDKAQQTLNTNPNYVIFKEQLIKINALYLDVKDRNNFVIVNQAQDSTNVFYNGELQYFDNKFPYLFQKYNEFRENCLNDSFIEESIKDFGKQYIDILEIARKTTSQQVNEQLAKENHLVSTYKKQLTLKQITFQNNSYSLSNFRNLVKSLDKESIVNNEGHITNELNFHHNNIGELFDSLIHVRHEIAIKLGFENFVPLGYARLNRTSFEEKEINIFRELIVKYVTPKIHELKSNQTISTKKLSPKLQIDKNELMTEVKNMYLQISKEAYDLFISMQTNEMFDLEAKPNKWNGSFMKYFYVFNSPFIFSNFNNTIHDFNILTHEFGHCFQCFCSSKHIFKELLFPTKEIAEISAITMSFFSWKSLDVFFKQDTDKYKHLFLSETLSMLPYCACVDEFQSVVYKYPEMKPFDRNELWLRLEKKYMPWLNGEENPVFHNESKWHTNAHIFSSPFYFIDYAIAYYISFQFHIKIEKDFDNSWKDFQELCSYGGTKNLREIISAFNLQSPFNEENFESTIFHVVDEIKQLENL